jgi:succinate dehydrogenase / fumarate reductase cytochrome b subunit
VSHCPDREKEMDISAQKARVETYLAGLMERSEKLSYYEKLTYLVRSRGWGFVLTWAHKVTGLMLVLYMFLHIITLSGLHDPAGFASKMRFLDNFLFGFLEWTLAVPVIFHALNGTRLMLYEIFRVREDALMIRWVLFLSALYALTLGLFMLMGNQQVSVGLFWLTVTMVGVIAAAIVYQRVWPTSNMVWWKLQRISGAFLLPMVSGHMFFMHLSFKVGHDAETIIARMSGIGMKFVDIVFVITVFFHAGFGVYTIIVDYIEDRRARVGLSLLTVLVMTVFAYAGVKLAFSI